MKKKLTESQAWKYLADAFTEENRKLFSCEIVYVSIGRFASACICAAIDYMYFQDMISKPVTEAMEERMKVKMREVHGEMGDYFFPRTLAGLKKRSALCLEFSKLTAMKKG